MGRSNREINSNQDIMDSRDVIEAYEELQAERDDLELQIENANDAIRDAQEAQAESESDDETAVDEAIIDLKAAREALSDWDDENGEELKTLRELCEEGESSADDWPHGVTLIRDSYFVQYAMDLADDLGLIDRKVGWPNSCIDWNQAARELKMDYTSLEFEGVTYYVR